MYMYVRTSWVQIAATIALLSDKIIVGANTASAVQFLLASCLMLILSNLSCQAILQLLQLSVLQQMVFFKVTQQVIGVVTLNAANAQMADDCSLAVGFPFSFTQKPKCVHTGEVVTFVWSTSTGSVVAGLDFVLIVSRIAVHTK